MPLSGAGECEMNRSLSLNIAIVDYGLGNLFSIQNACAFANMNPIVTSSPLEMMNADAVILPGVGAFGDAMISLSKLDLVHPLIEIAGSGKILFGICLGMQLLMTESYEFGQHKGLGIIDGTVVRFKMDTDAIYRKLKVPQVGWNHIYRMNENFDSWEKTPLAGLNNGEFMYFVHSYFVKPDNESMVLSLSDYGNISFCSSIKCGNVFGCQFHPERSGIKGLLVYKNLALWIKSVFQKMERGKYE